MAHYGSVSDAEAYTITCPTCKSAPGFTCTYLPQLNPKTGRWSPQSGKPTKKPHNERREAWRKRERKRDQALRDRLRLEEAKQARSTWRHSIARSIREGAVRDQRELVAWLREHAHLLTDLEKEQT